MLDIIHENFDALAKEAVVPLFKRKLTAVERFHKEVVTLATHKARAVLAGRGVLSPSRPRKPRTIAELLDDSSTQLARRVVSAALKDVCAQAGAQLDFH